jgi:hypothetical protein
VLLVNSGEPNLNFDVLLLTDYFSDFSKAKDSFLIVILFHLHVFINILVFSAFNIVILRENLQSSFSSCWGILRGILRCNCTPMEKDRNPLPNKRAISHYSSE